MDILGILNTLKGKVLDAVNFEKLQSAYTFQNKTIEQLSGNNDALKESNELLKENNASLKQENSDLKQRVSSLESELKDYRNSSSTELSDVAREILRQYVFQNENELAVGILERSLPFNKVEIGLGIDSLYQSGMIVQSRVDMGNGAGFSLTSDGKQRALKLHKE